MADRNHCCPRPFPGSLVAATSLALLLFLGFGFPGAVVGGAAAEGPRQGLLTGDPHRTPLPADEDHDYLGDAEEAILGSDPAEADENRNLLTDGPDWAGHCHLVLEALPSFPPGEPGPPRLYRVEHEMDGLENCLACGQAVNMGCTRVVNAPAGLVLQIPYLAIHSLAHGSLSYRGSLHEGRLPVGELTRVLRDVHALPVQGDADRDFLADGEEEGLNLDPQEADQNGNWEPDGIDLARLLAATVDGLPQGPRDDEVCRTDHYAAGVEKCSLCGEEINLGHARVLNPLRGLGIDLPYISLHAMGCGAFGYEGSTHSGRVEMVRLRDVLALFGPDS